MSLQQLINQKQSRLYYITHKPEIIKRNIAYNKKTKTMVNKRKRARYKIIKDKEILRCRTYQWIKTYLKKLCPICSAKYLQKGRLICYGCELNL